MSNKKSGTAFEKELCKKLAERGVWSRLEYPAEDGSQPFDVKAICGNKLYVFECKDCQNGYFDTSRFEYNQRMALNILENYMLDYQIFVALNFEGEWYFVPFVDIRIKEKEKKKKRFKKEEIMQFGSTANFEELIQIMEKLKWK